MKRFILLTTMLIVFSFSASRAEVDTVRIAYFQAGDYYLHKVIYREIATNLQQLQGDSLEFVYEPTAYKTADWKREDCRAMAAELARLAYVDIVIAAGPWVVDDLLAAGFEKPIVGVYQFDPEITGLVDYQGRPKAENLTVTYDPDKLKNDMEMIQTFFPTNRMGLVYFPNNDEFDSMVEKFHAASGKYGAAVYAGNEYNNYSQYSFNKSFLEIRDQIEALYLPPLWGMKLDQINQFLEEVSRAKIPTYSFDGFLIVEKGATACNTTQNYSTLAMLSALKMVKIARGTKPSDLPSRYSETGSVGINLNSVKYVRNNISREYILNGKTVKAFPDEYAPHYNMNSAIEQAKRENPNVYVYESRISEALENSSSSYSALYPEISASLSIAETDNETASTLYNYEHNRKFGLDIELEQTLVSYPLLKSIRNARKQVDLSRLDNQIYLNSLDKLTAISYLTILRLEEIIDQNYVLIDEYRKYIYKSSALAQFGLIDSLDLSLFEEEQVKAKLANHHLQSELDIAYDIFNILIGRPGDARPILDRAEFSTDNMVFLVRLINGYITTDDRQKKFTDYLIEYGLGNSIGLERADLQIDMASGNLTPFGKRMIPELKLKARYSAYDSHSQEIDNSDNYWFVGASLSLPLFNRGKMFKENRVAQSRVDAELYKKDLLRFNIFKNISIRTSKFTENVRTMPIHYFLNNLAKSNLEKLLDRYYGGKISAFDLIDRTENSFTTQQDLIKRRYLMFENYAMLLQTIGETYLYHGTETQKEFYNKLEERLK